MIDRKMFMPAQSFFAVAFILSVMSVPATAQELAAAAGDASAPVASVVAPLTIPADVFTAAGNWQMQSGLSQGHGPVVGHPQGLVVEVFHALASETARRAVNQI